jgi:uncharacterized protein
MFWAILITFASVMLGTALALLSSARDSWLGPVRTFGLTAALSVVVIHLLPSALTVVGVWAIAVFFFGLVAPELLGKLGEMVWRARHTEPTGPQNSERRRTMALEASYFGLLLHQFGDGLGLGAFTGEMYAASGSGGVIVALSAHAVPVVAIMVLSFDAAHGRGSALVRALGLALASTIGVWFSHSIPGVSFATASAFISAFVGGTLLHVMTHDLGHDLPKTAPSRLVDLFAAALGIYVSMIGGESHQHAGTHDPAEQLVEVLIRLTMDTLPYLLVGLVLGAMLMAWGRGNPDRFFELPGARRGARNWLPAAADLMKSGAGGSLLISVLLVMPELGFETLALSVQFLGWKIAALRLLLALALALGLGVLVRLTAKRSQFPRLAPSPPTAQAMTGPILSRILHAFDELLHHVGAWLLMALVAAALLEVSLPGDALAQEGFVGELLVIAVIALATAVCAPSALPLGAVLIHKGASPGAIVMGLILGSASHIAILAVLWRSYGKPKMLLGLLTITVLSWFSGRLVDTWQLAGQGYSFMREPAAGASQLGMAASVLSGLIVLRSLYTAGFRGFFSTLVGQHGHSHGAAAAGADELVSHACADPNHDHAHGHAHSHDHAHGHGHHH